MTPTKKLLAIQQYLMPCYIGQNSPFFLLFICLLWCHSFNSYAQVLPNQIPQNINNTIEQKKSQINKAKSLWNGLSDAATSKKIQKKHSDSLKVNENIFFGGDFGVAVGGQQVFINISPLVGVKMAERFNAGGGLIFQYQRTQLLLVDVGGIKYETTASNLIYGAKAFNRIFLFDRVFAQAEAEMINMALIQSDGARERIWVPGIWAGTGYSLKLVGNVALNFTVAYNLAYQKGRSPYASPLDIRMGFQF